MALLYNMVLYVSPGYFSILERNECFWLLVIPMVLNRYRETPTLLKNILNPCLNTALAHTMLLLWLMSINIFFFISPSNLFSIFVMLCHCHAIALLILLLSLAASAVFLLIFVVLTIWLKCLARTIHEWNIQCVRISTTHISQASSAILITVVNDPITILIPKKRRKKNDSTKCCGWRQYNFITGYLLLFKQFGTQYLNLRSNIVHRTFKW